MKELMIAIPEGYVIDEEKSSVTCIIFKKEENKEVKCWEDLKIIKGYVVGNYSDIQQFVNDGLSTTSDNRNIFATEEQAEASIALAMLSQLMKEVNGDWIPDWKDTNRKYFIRFFNDHIDVDNTYSIHYFLAFPTEEIRDMFLKNHKELIIKAKPLL